MVQAYNYMVESFPKREDKYSVNNRRELKKVYDSIVNLSKHSPLYKINLSKENQDYTIDVKELAIVLKTKIGDMSDPANAGFHSKTVAVSNARVLTADLISEETNSLPENISISVNFLASGQTNRGKELFHPSKGLERGTYKFSANIINQIYPLTYTQQERMENSDTLQKMAGFLNQSLPQITATVEKGDKENYSRIDITSNFTGSNKFFFTEDDDFQEGIVGYFGLNRMEKAPSNANFVLNGINKQTITNSFTLENTLQISLLNTEEEPVNIRIVPDKNQILRGVDSVLQAFNGLIHIAKTRTEKTKEHFGATKLVSELKNLEKLYKDEMEACGFKVSDQGMIILDDALATQACEDGGMESLFTRENGFIAKVLNKAEAITINPMEYLDKTIVTYPDSEKTAYANPYVTSMYSGMFFNSYC